MVRSGGRGQRRVHPGPREVLIWGLQGLTELSDEVLTSVELSAGPHVVVFLLGALKGGEVEVDVFEAPAEEAA